MIDPQRVAFTCRRGPVPLASKARNCEYAMLSEILNNHTQRLTLIVAQDILSLQDFARHTQADLESAGLDLGRDLSLDMLDTRPARRGVFVDRWVRKQILALPAKQIVCTNIDLLFEPGLQLDPLALFLKHSRAKSLVVLWPGAYAGGILSYAVPAHGHYRTWRQPEAAVFSLQHKRFLQRLPSL